MRVEIFLVVTTLALWSVASPLPRNYESVVRISYIPAVVGREVMSVRPLPSNADKGVPIEKPKPRKGEYNCGRNGERLCKLEPGVIPKNCNGVCQYPV